ncbi:MAG: hypothetical protein ABUT20_05885 [Bacteroidota bacterium]
MKTFFINSNRLNICLFYFDSSYSISWDRLLRRPQDPAGTLVRLVILFNKEQLTISN